MISPISWHFPKNLELRIDCNIQDFLFACSTFPLHFLVTVKPQSLGAILPLFDVHVLWLESNSPQCRGWHVSGLSQPAGPAPLATVIGLGMGRWPDVCWGVGQGFCKNLWEDRPLFLELRGWKPGVVGSHSVTMRWESVWEQNEMQGSGVEIGREIGGRGGGGRRRGGEENGMKKKGRKRGDGRRRWEEKEGGRERHRALRS